MTVPTAPADASCPAPVCKPSAEATQTPCGRSQASSGVLEADPLTCESNQCQCPVPLPGPAAQLTQHIVLQTTGLQLSRHILCLVPAGSLGGHSRVLGATRAVPCHLGTTKSLVWGAESGDRAGRPALQAGGRPHGAGPIPPAPALLGSVAVYQASCSMDFRLGLRGDSTGQGLGSDLLPTWQQALAP